MTACNASSPSNSAAGPGCRMIGDLISCSSPSRTAGIADQPGRAATCSGRNFLPHHEPNTMSGARRTTSPGSASDAIARERHRGALRKHVVAAGDADQLGDPADAGDQRIVPLLEIDARAARQLRRGALDLGDVIARALHVGLGLRRRADQRAEPQHVVENAFDAAMIRRSTLRRRRARDRARCRPGCRKNRSTRSGSSARIAPIFALVNADTFGFSLRARGGRTVKPEMPTMRCSSPSA